MFTELDRFEAISNNGQRYTVIQLQHCALHRTHTGEIQQVPTSVEWKTLGGLDLSENGDATFEMVQHDEILRRI